MGLLSLLNGGVGGETKNAGANDWRNDKAPNPMMVNEAEGQPCHQWDT